MSASKGRTRRATTTRRRTTDRRWSRRVVQTSNALDLEQGVFSKRTPGQVALSLKRSADASRRRKSDPYRSAMSMLNRRVLNAAKQELRRLYHRDK